jgi:hypothetical protein
MDTENNFTVIRQGQPAIVHVGELVVGDICQGEFPDQVDNYGHERLLHYMYVLQAAALCLTCQPSREWSLVGRF